jgi:Holliday junction resolvase-like predicted endonuclease
LHQDIVTFYGRKKVNVMFWSEPRRKSKKQRLREKHKRSYRKGKEFENKVEPFLKRKVKISVLSTRVHSKGLREEFDRIVADKHGKLYAVEVKATKQKVGVQAVDKFQRKISKYKGLTARRYLCLKKWLYEGSRKQEAQRHRETDVSKEEEEEK